MCLHVMFYILCLTQLFTERSLFILTVSCTKGHLSDQPIVWTCIVGTMATKDKVCTRSLVYVTFFFWYIAKCAHTGSVPANRVLFMHTIILHHFYSSMILQWTTTVALTMSWTMIRSVFSQNFLFRFSLFAILYPQQSLSSFLLVWFLSLLFSLPPFSFTITHFSTKLHTSYCYHS